VNKLPVKKHFINRGIQETLIEEYLGSQLDNSGYAGIDMQKTPIGTRITIKTSRPGTVIGHKGGKVKELTDEVKSRFNINVQTIDVETVENPDLNAQIQAERIAYAIKKGQNYRRAAYSIIRRIMKSGARGIEVHVSGKTTSQRARTQVFRAGIISKCGIPSIEGVDRGVYHLILKSGILGIRVKIMPNSYKMPDEVIIRQGIFDKPEEKPVVVPVDEFYNEEIDKEIDELENEEEEALFEDVSEAKEKEIVETPPVLLEESKDAQKTNSSSLPVEEQNDETNTDKKSSKRKATRKKKSGKKSNESDEETNQENSSDES
jgi:small subunit ribosomal protein S3